MFNRSPERIELILKTLEVAWKKNPDLRLGQLISNAIMMTDYASENKDFYYIEDNELEQRLLMYLGDLAEKK